MRVPLRYFVGMAGMLMAAPFAHAATTPSLGAAASYGVLGSTYTNTVPGTTINGDVGFTTGPAVVPGGAHPNYGSGAPYPTAVTDQGAALSALAAQPCTFTFVPGPIDLSTDATHGPVGVYTPGVYCSTGAMNVGGPLTLSGSGTYIFRPVGALTSTAGSIITLSGAAACDVFWTPSAATTLAANTTFAGTVIANAGITVGAVTTWSGRALAAGGTVTTDTDTISVPVCAAPVVPPTVSSSSVPPLIHVQKVPSPLALPAGPGSVTYTYTVTNPGTIPLANITLVDDKCPAQYVSGDIDNNKQLGMTESWKYTCTTSLAITTLNIATARGTDLTNSMAAIDSAVAYVVVGVPVVPPLINVVKTPSPLTLPFNGGAVTYSYTVTNPGTVALSNVVVTDNKCATVSRVSGDVNSDNRLQSNETWRYTCTTTLSLTTTNTAVATGQANGLTAIDTALATVVVAGSPVPPLIHIVKKPEPVLLPAGGGSVTYTYTVTNPGTVALNNVAVTDDKCSVVTTVAGDANGNLMLDTNETWTYTCQQTLTATSANTATARGTGNGLTVTDLAVANVPVSPALLPSIPALPNTGFGPTNQRALWIVLAAGAIVATTLLFAATKRKRAF